MSRAFRLGALYFVAVFVVGFAFGALRTLLVAPAIGALAATLLELPLVLAVAWAVWGRLARGLRLGLPSRGAAGGFAFLLLMAAEAMLSTLVFGRSLVAHLASYHAAPEALGLAGQVVFAAMPAHRRG